MVEGINSDQATNWSLRSRQLRTDPRSVLYKSMPPVINDYIHKWHLDEIYQVLDRFKDRKIDILDIGCGYGRLSKPISERYDNVSITGIDISRNFVDMFNQSMRSRGKAILGSVTNIPLESESFDFILVVTTLMYVHDELNQASGEIFRVLRPGGECLLIENNIIGVKVYPLGGLINILRRQPIRDYSFFSGEIDQAIGIHGGKIIWKHGFPIFTFNLIFIFILSKLSTPIASAWLRLCYFFDQILLNRTRFSLCISYLARKVD